MKKKLLAVFFLAAMAVFSTDPPGGQGPIKLGSEAGSVAGVFGVEPGGGS
jgi:hypothetical protein